VVVVAVVVAAGAAPDRAVHDVRDEHGGVHGGAGQARRRPARRHLHRSVRVSSFPSFLAAVWNSDGLLWNTIAVWKELEKENKEFFDQYKQWMSEKRSATGSS
jgi:hypothetical protein